MEFTNEFTIPVGIDDAFAVLTDLERVAPCMPGATLEEVDGDTYSGRVKVKVGPMSLTYAGTATVTEADEASHTAAIRASGREKRGAGTADADVSASMIEKDGETVVTVVTDIRVTGKPAQFGRGVMADVGEKIIDRFAVNLRDELESGAGAAATVTSTSTSTSAATAVAEPAAETTEPADAAGAASTGPRKVAHQPPRDEALDLVEVAGRATARRLAPVVAGALVLVALIVFWRRSRRDESA